MDFLEIKTLEEAHMILQDLANKKVLESENIPIISSVARFLSSPVIAHSNVPSFDRSTVDGFALRFEDVSGSSDSVPTLMSKVGEVKMGECACIDVKNGEAVYVPTGGGIPHGANAVVMIEHCEMIDDMTLLVKDPVHYGENISYSGDDLQLGAMVLEAGRRITPLDVAVLAGLGFGTVEVYKPLKVTIISTGDEIVEPTKDLPLGKINDMNGYGLRELIREDGLMLVERLIVTDQFELIKAAVEKGLIQSDLVVLSGGSSAGERDYTSQVIESVDGGELLVHGLAVKPGKPTMIGAQGSKLIVGLPGHPSAAMLIYGLTVRHYLKSLLKTKAFERVKVKAKLKQRLQSAPGKDSFAMVSLVETEEAYDAFPIHGKSGLITLMASAAGYIHIGKDQEGLLEGSWVTVHLMSSQLIKRG